MAEKSERPESNRAISQAGVVPYRFTRSKLKICLITTRRSGLWGFPKGRIRKDESVHDAALNEAFEEAGLTGQIIGEVLGRYTYTKRNRQQTVEAFLMKVERCNSDWKESAERERCWVTPDEARQLLTRINLLELLEEAILRISATTDDLPDSSAVSA